MPITGLHCCFGSYLGGASFHGGASDSIRSRKDSDRNCVLADWIADSAFDVKGRRRDVLLDMQY